MLVSWLSTGHVCDDKGAHTDRELVKELCSPEQLEWRQSIRDSLREMADFRDLLEQEEGGAADAREPDRVT